MRDANSFHTHRATTIRSRPRHGKAKNGVARVHTEVSETHTCMRLIVPLSRYGEEGGWHMSTGPSPPPQPSPVCSSRIGAWEYGKAQNSVLNSYKPLLIYLTERWPRVQDYQFETLRPAPWWKYPAAPGLGLDGPKWRISGDTW